MTKNKFVKNYERRSQVDGQLWISVKAETECDTEEYADGCFLVTTTKACTKNGDNSFDLSASEVSTYLSDLSE